MHFSKEMQLIVDLRKDNWPDDKRVVDMVTGKAYKIPVYYILLHGLNYKTLPSLGFPEIS